MDGGSTGGGPTAVARLVEVVAQLREHCLWTAALTHESLVEYLVEESYELAEAIETGHTRAEDAEELKGELADVLFQVLLHARIQEERGTFGFDDVARLLTDKLVRRNRHVFRPDGTLQDSFPAAVEDIVAGYDAAKAAEKPGRTTPFDGLPRSLPALTLAAKSLDRAARAGIAGMENPGPAAAEPADPATEDDIGDLLLAVVRRAMANGVDAEQALRAAVRRFQRDVTGP
jgi:uncharacterized protein YabN with tetrapyrrole methylase and pyrophosphatase domain